MAIIKDNPRLKPKDVVPCYAYKQDMHAIYRQMLMLQYYDKCCCKYHKKHNVRSLYNRATFRNACEVAYLCHHDIEQLHQAPGTWIDPPVPFDFIYHELNRAIMNRRPGFREWEALAWDGIDSKIRKQRVSQTLHGENCPCRNWPLTEYDRMVQANVDGIMVLCKRE